MGMLDLFREWLEHRTGDFRPRHRTGLLRAETLESRLVLSPVLIGTTLDVNGTAGNDTISVTQNFAGVTVVIDSTTTSYGPGTTINAINVFGVAGNDQITIDSVFNSTALTVDGGSGNNTLISPNLSNSWVITGANSGSLNGDPFTNIQNLTGSGFNDNFRFAMNGFVEGNVDGGGGIDVLDYSTRNVGAVANLAAMSATAIGGHFANITDFHGSADNTDMLSGMNTANVWHISGPNSGDINGQFFYTGVENLTGGTSSDDFVFGTFGIVGGTVTGGAGSNTLDYSNVSSAIVTNLQGNTSTLIAVGFNQIGTVIGNTNPTDRLIGIDQSNVWNITTPNSGTINSVFTTTNFQSFDNLTGGIAGDRFKFSDGAFIAGVVNGGGGFDTLDYSPRTSGIVVNLQSNSATSIGGGFTSIEAIVGSMSTTDILIGANTSNVFNISGPNSGNVNGAFFFSSIENLTGGTKNDSFNFLPGQFVSGQLLPSGYVSGVIEGGQGVNTLDYSAVGTSPGVIANQQPNEVLTLGQPLTAGGKPATASTSLDLLDQTTISANSPYGYTTHDLISIQGARVDGTPVSTNFIPTGIPSADTVGALLAAINRAYLSASSTSGAIASLNSAGQIELTANHRGPTSARLALANNPISSSGTSTQFSTFVKTVSATGVFVDLQPTEILTMGLPLTVAGAPAAVSTSLDALDQTTPHVPGYKAGDTINITGTRFDGRPVKAVFKLTGVPASDLVGTLLGAINDAYLSGTTSGATASLNSNGQIVLTATHPQSSGASITLTSNASGTSTAFSPFVTTATNPTATAVGGGFLHISNFIGATQPATAVFTLRQPLTVGGAPPVVSTSLDLLDQTTPHVPGYASGDAIDIKGTRFDGTTVNAVFPLTGVPSSDTIGALLNAIDQAYVSATSPATASLNFSGQIVLTAINPQSSSASITLTSNPLNPSGTSTAFSTFVPTPGTRLPSTLIGLDTANTWNITGRNIGNINGAFTFSSFQNLTGGLGVDVFHDSIGGSIDGIVNGGPVPTGAGSGADWLDYSAFLTPVTVNLSTGDATEFGSVSNVQNVRGGDGVDTLSGNSIGNVLVGGQAADTITGGTGLSLLIGGLGSDTITGGASPDIVIGDYTDYDKNFSALTSILAEWQAEWAAVRAIGVPATSTNGPVGKSNSVTTLGNAPFTFAIKDFGFTDPKNTPSKTLTAVVITTLPGGGTLTDKGVNVTAGQSVPVADIAGGKLVFAPAYGVAFTNFTFQVKDSGSTANLDPNPKPMTIFINLNSLISNLRNTGGLNGNNVLVADVTVHNDGALDAIRGGAGPNWLWSQPAELKDRTSQDIVDVPIHNQPILTGPDNVTFDVGRFAVLVDPGINITSTTSATIASATVTIGQNYNSTEDNLGFSASAATGNIVGSFNKNTGVLTLTSAGATATVAQFQAALSQVTYYNPSATPTTGTRTVYFQVFDGSLYSNSLASTVALNFPPVLLGTSTLNYQTLQAATPINPNILVSDIDQITLQSATVRISNLYQSNQDLLSFAGNGSTGDLVGNFDSFTGILTLTSAGAPATIAQYQAALRLVTYQDFAAFPLTQTRTVSYQVSDGFSTSNIVNSLIKFV